MGRLAFVVLLVAGSAFAGERVRIAVHPIAAPGIDDAKLVIELNREQLNILAETEHLTIAAAEDVERRLAEEGGRCPTHGKERIECLERVALATRATYSLAVTVKRLGNDFELTATIADSDRVPLEQPPALSCAGNGPVKAEVALKAQLRVLLLEHIKAAMLPEDPRKLNASGIPPPPPPMLFVEKEPTPPYVAPKTADTATQLLGKIVMGVGGASAVVGAVLIGVSAGQRNGISVDGNGNIPIANKGLVDSTRTMQTAGGAMLGFGAAIAAAGGVLWLMSPNAPAVISVAPTRGGAGVMFTGELP